MKAISEADAKREFSQVMWEVREGESFTVTSEGKAVAVISPLAGRPAGRDAAFEDLIARLKNQPPQDLPKLARAELYDD